jgi:hypothetical protein
MARRTSPIGHVACQCGKLCPIMYCACGNSQNDDRCTWCTWWDEHEPHDIPAYRPNIAEMAEFLVRYNNGTLNHDDDCDCEPCATRKANIANA